MGKITETKVNTHDEWLAERQKGIGGSDASIIVGLNKWESPYSLWLDKLGQSEPKAENLAMKVGTFNEEFVAKEFEARTGKKVRRRNRVIRNSDYPFAHANVDRWIVGEKAGLECKTTSAWNEREFKNGQYPDHYYVQCMHYMAVTGAQKYYLAVLIGNHDFKIFEVQRDEDVIADLMEAEKAFWEMVKEEIPPEVDGSEATTEALKQRFNRPNESAVEIVGHDRKARRLVEIANEIKDLKKEEETIKQEFFEILGNSSYGSTENFEITYKTQKPRATFDRKAFEESHPEIDLRPFYKEGKAPRPFRIKEIL